MTKISNVKVKCAVCGYESEQLVVYSVNSLMGTKEENDKLINSKQKCPKCGYRSNDISKNDVSERQNDIMESVAANKSKREQLLEKIDKKIEEIIVLRISKMLNLTVEETLKNKKVVEENLTYYYNPIKGGMGLITDKEGMYLTAPSSVSLEKLIEEFKKGEGLKSFIIDEKKEKLNEKLLEEKYFITYSKGTLRPGNTIFSRFIIIDDIICKDINGDFIYLQKQNEKIDKVWNYVNLMQGNIRSEAEKVKKLPHVKDTAKDEITFNLNGEIFTLTGKITDESSINFYNKIVNDILEIIK